MAEILTDMRENNETFADIPVIDHLAAITQFNEERLVRDVSPAIDGEHVLVADFAGTELSCLRFLLPLVNMKGL